MPRRHVVWLLIVPVVCVIARGALAGPSRGAKDDHEAVAEAQRLTDQAVAAGVEGDLAERRELLARAQRIAPNYGPPRWEQGLVEREGVWLSPNDSREDRSFAEYDRLRGLATDAPTDHLALARWCRRAGLDDEARYHWLRVLAVVPSHREALDATGSVWSGEGLVPADESRERLAAARDFVRRQQEWGRKLREWEYRLHRKSVDVQGMVSEARSIRDEAAIAAFERFADRARNDRSDMAIRRREISLAFVDASSAQQGSAMSESLVRHAMWAPDPEVASAAASLLPQRPKHEVVPALIMLLESPIETEFSINVSSSGVVSYSHTAWQEGPEAIVEANTSHIAAPRLQLTDLDGEVNPQEVNRQRTGIARAAGIVRLQASRIERQVAARNATSTMINARTTDLLAQVTGKELGDVPGDWWAYWQDYNGYEVPPVKPTVRRYSATNSNYQMGCECFAAGTSVWTKRGEVAIETLRAGDVVLSKDTHTGEMLYRPVLATTVRPPSLLLRVVGEGVDVRLTRGHPVWVVNKGWRMAKELVRGDVLWAIEGPSRVERVEKATEERAYNLVVEGTATYFVGRRGVLSHDNTPRRPDREFVGAPAAVKGSSTGG